MAFNIRSLFGYAMMVASVALAGCLAEQTDPDKTSDAGQLDGSYYAGTLSGTAIKIQNSVAGDTSWVTNPSQARMLDLAAMGISPKTTDGVIKSGLCPLAGGQEAVQLTWVESATNAADSGKNIGALMRDLSKFVAPNQLGSTSGASTIQMADGTSMNLPSTCSVVAIPKGVPVLAFRMSKPSGANIAQTANTEYRTQPCPEGMVGTIVQKRVVSYGTNGQPVIGEWAFENSGQCTQDDTVVADVKTIEGGASADMRGFADQQVVDGQKKESAVASALRDNLKMDCVSVELKTNAKKQETTAGRTADANTKTGLNTCGNVTIAATQALETWETRENEETRSIPCTGAVAAGNLAIGAFTGQTTNSLWSGDMVFARTNEISELAGGTGQGSSGVLAKGAWKPVSLSCTRADKLTVRCADITPTGGQFAAAITNADLVYGRELKINSFTKLEGGAIGAGKAQTGEWKLASGTCQWVETEAVTTTCPDDQIAVDGKRIRTLSADPGAADGYARSAWVETEAPLCVPKSAFCVAYY